MITKEIALSLEYRATLHHVREKNSDGSPVRCRVNGKCKTWVTRPNDFQLPVKHGLRDCFYITPANAQDWVEPVKDESVLMTIRVVGIAANDGKALARLKRAVKRAK